MLTYVRSYIDTSKQLINPPTDTTFFYRIFLSKLKISDPKKYDYDVEHERFHYYGFKF